MDSWLNSRCCESQFLLKPRLYPGTNWTNFHQVVQRFIVSAINTRVARLGPRIPGSSCLKLTTELASATLDGNLFQALITRFEKNCSLMLVCDLGFSRVSGDLLSAESVRTRNKFLSSGDELLLRALKTSIRSPLFRLRSSENNPSFFSLFLYKRNFIPVIISVKVLWTFSRTS